VSYLSHYARPLGEVMLPPEQTADYKCRQLGGRTEIRMDPAKQQSGLPAGGVLTYCVLPDGSACEYADLMAGKCPLIATGNQPSVAFRHALPYVAVAGVGALLWLLLRKP
jgi:uncharacterized protein DUF333